MWQINDVTYCFYAVDFSLGFCSRIIQGAIHQLLFNTVNTTTVTVYWSAIFVFTAAVICFLAEMIILKTEPEYRKTAIITFLFFFTGPCTFSMYFKVFGLIDFFWLFSMALFFLVLQKKQLWFLTVPISVFMIFVYYSAILCYVPLLAILLLYKIATETKKKDKKYLTAIFFASVILCLFFTFYFVFFERSNLNYTMEEFDNILMSRGVEEGSLYYYNYSYYRHLDNFTENTGAYLPTVDENSSPLLAFKVIMQQLSVTFKLIDFSHITLISLLLILPISAYIYRYIIREMKNTRDNKLKRFSLFCMLALFPFTIITGLCLSTDVVRWISNAFTPLFIAFIYVVFKNNDWKSVHNDINSVPLSYLIPYYLVYAFTTFLPDAK
ncbi:MAG: hypothetical protein ACI4VW_07490 [Acutalibacteraceae bacterium]